MLFRNVAVLALFAGITFAAPARAQTTVPGQPLVPLGYCQLSASQLSASVGLASCVRASFTGTGAGLNLTASSVAGIIKSGDVVTGTGAPAGTTIVSQTSGTTGGAGVYVTSGPTTSSSASLTAGGIPPGATSVYLESETAPVRYRDDGGAPTTSVGMIVQNAVPIYYVGGPLSQLRFIAASGSPLLNAAFYR